MARWLCKGCIKVRTDTYAVPCGDCCGYHQREEVAA